MTLATQSPEGTKSYNVLERSLYPRLSQYSNRFFAMCRAAGGNSSSKLIGLSFISFCRSIAKEPVHCAVEGEHYRIYANRSRGPAAL